MSDTDTTKKPKAKAAKTKASDTRSFEAQLWEACEAQRGSVNASRYKHPVLGLVFLKYVNDNFEHYRTELATRLADPADDYYLDGQGLAVYLEKIGGRWSVIGTVWLWQT